NESCGHLGKQFTHLSLKGGYDQSSIAISFSVVSQRGGSASSPAHRASVAQWNDLVFKLNYI
ncbi:hypothetical protein, partial [Niallia sp. MER TA 168]|uniref:hypothetical protein n=1 Tax=Niallia sp. MER TA 168 TaxID=2939568 RepID=UPI00203C8E73